MAKFSNGLSIPKVGGMVLIKSKVGNKIVGRTVPIAPAFDPNAISMVPIPGWLADPDAPLFHDALAGFSKAA